jgi:SpoVK/Ycf46/Vps4 family AAA+-type ATPase
LRKGRFDELFRVDLPTPEERRRIFEIHLKKRGKLTEQVDVLKLLKDTEGYSGADIESLIKETVEAAFISDDKSISTEKLKKAMENTKSISITLKDKIEKLKETYEKFDFQKANGDIESMMKNKQAL